MFNVGPRSLLRINLRSVTFPWEHEIAVGLWYNSSTIKGTHVIYRFEYVEKSVSIIKLIINVVTGGNGIERMFNITNIRWDYLLNREMKVEKII